MTAAEITRLLAAAGMEPDSARTEARLLIEHFAAVPLSHVLAFPEQDYSSPALENAVRRRAERYPLQYILGEWYFMGLPFSVNESCLIPRPDTETVAEAAIRHLKERHGASLLDLCTGSGCIATAVLHYTGDTTAAAVELDPNTAETARENLRRLNLEDRCRVMTGDAAADLFPPNITFDVITANPPYVAKDEMPFLEPELAFEPRIALTDEDDGLSLTRKIIELYPSHLKPDGLMLLEHSPRQTNAVRQIAESHNLSCTTLFDYHNRPRAAALRQTTPTAATAARSSKPTSSKSSSASWTTIFTRTQKPSPSSNRKFWLTKRNAKR